MVYTLYVMVPARGRVRCRAAVCGLYFLYQAGDFLAGDAVLSGLVVDGGEGDDPCAVAFALVADGYGIVQELLQHRRHLADVGKPFEEGLVGLGCLHVVAGLLTEPDVGVDAERRLEQEGVLCGYGPLAVEYLVEQRGRDAHLCGELPLRQPAVFDFILYHFARVYGDGRSEIVGNHPGVNTF